VNRITMVARDARLITGALDAIVDLKLIGDYAYEMVGLGSVKQCRPPSQSGCHRQLAQRRSGPGAFVAAARSGHPRRMPGLG